MSVIRVWQWDLDGPASADEAAMLSPAEHARAARFIVPHASARFIASRIAMRKTLAALLDRDPASLVLLTTDTGKPFIRSGPCFNLSHSGAVALFAVAEHAVGIDVEAIRPIDTGVERLVFTPSEQRYLGTLPPAARQAAFYRGWTRKEAVIKAGGRTLADLQTITALPDYAGLLGVIDLPMQEGFAAAVAAPGDGWTVSVQSQGPQTG